MELQTYDGCVKNKHLFKRIRDGDGRFVFELDGSFGFNWFVDGVHHRVDGPAFIYDKACEWYFCGVYADGVCSQAEFNEWLMGNL